MVRKTARSRVPRSIAVVFPWRPIQSRVPNSSIPEISLANLPPDLQLELEPDSIFVQSPGGENGSAARARSAGASVPLQRGSGWESTVAARASRIVNQGVDLAFCVHRVVLCLVGDRD